MIGIEQVPYAVISGAVLMGQPHSYGGHPYIGSPGIVINPWIGIGGGHGRHDGHRRGHRGHDD